MTNKVYYGEYSLKHWINLMLKKNIILPDYQRHFVWDENSVKGLIKSIQDNLFVPSVTIGSYEDKNLIIDGQQRLTSILLVYLGIYPKKDKFKRQDIEKYIDENDDFQDEQDDNNFGIEWTFKKLLIGDEKAKILEKIEKDKYSTLDISIKDDFWDTHYLGFSYLIPEKKQQKGYFSSVFININKNGKSLSDLETRRALYSLDEKMKDIFDPEYIKNIYLGNTKKDPIDFVRYLSIACQYSKSQNEWQILIRYGSKREEYYNKFINKFINKTTNDMFIDYKDDLGKRIRDNLKTEIEKIKLKDKKIESIIDYDVYMFGLVYFVVVKGMIIDDNKKDILIDELDKAIEEFKRDKLHKKTPSALKYLRLRFIKSINIYKEYAK